MTFFLFLLFFRSFVVVVVVVNASLFSYEAFLLVKFENNKSVLLYTQRNNVLRLYNLKKIQQNIYMFRLYTERYDDDDDARRDTATTTATTARRSFLSQERVKSREREKGERRET